MQEDKSKGSSKKSSSRKPAPGPLSKPPAEQIQNGSDSTGHVLCTTSKSPAPADTSGRLVHESSGGPLISAATNGQPASGVSANGNSAHCPRQAAQQNGAPSSTATPSYDAACCPAGSADSSASASTVSLANGVHHDKRALQGAASGTHSNEHPEISQENSASPTDAGASSHFSTIGPSSKCCGPRFSNTRFRISFKLKVFLANYLAAAIADHFEH